VTQPKIMGISYCRPVGARCAASGRTRAYANVSYSGPNANVLVARTTRNRSARYGVPITPLLPRRAPADLL